MPEHEYFERMTCVCECGFDYRQASAVRAERGMLLARAMRSQRAPKNLAEKTQARIKDQKQCSEFWTETDVMITLWRELEIGTTHKTSSFFATRAAEELKLLWKLSPSLLATGPLPRGARVLARSSCRRCQWRR